MRLLRRCSPLCVALAAAVLAGPALAAPAVAATDQLSSVTITGGPDEKPVVAVAAPVSVKKTTNKVVAAGDGDKARDGASVIVDYVIVNGRTGSEGFATSYGSGAETFPLDRSKIFPAIVDNLVGARVGTRVMIAVAPKVGMAKAQAQASSDVKASDTLLFVADIRGTYGPFDRATGTAVAPVDGLPAVKLAKDGAPTITMPTTTAPPSLVVQPLITGPGPVVKSGQTLTVQYTGAIWDGGKVFDSSWKAARDPFSVPLGAGQVIQGWETGLVGQTVGSQVLLVIPPDLGYGAAGRSGAGIKGTDTLVFVVDILDAA